MKKLEKFKSVKTINKSDKKVSYIIYKSPSRPWEIMDIKVITKK